MDALTQALDTYNKGFNSMAAKKRCLDTLRKQYDALAAGISKAILAQREANPAASERLTDLYYVMPEFHNWKPKHEALYCDFKTEVVAITQLIALRNKVKAAPVTPKPTNTDKIAINRVMYLVKDKTGQVDLSKKLGLPVSVNVHEVTGHDRADYIRCFFYLNGELTSLSAIVALMQDRK